MVSSFIKIHQIDKVFRDGFWLKKNQVLFNICLDIKKNTVCGLLGPNGAGKTTLIHLMMGVRKPAAGIIEIDGKSAGSLEARSMMGYLPERPYFPEHLTAREFLSYMGILSKLEKETVKKRISEVLSLVDLTAAVDVQLKKFSKGMLQRVGIAQAIIHNPEVLILDEPMSGLDPIGRKEIRELIEDLAKKGKTIFFSSHIIPDVEAICDQVAVIKKGHLVAFGPIGNFLSQEDVKIEIAFTGVKNEDLAAVYSIIPQIDKISDGFKCDVNSHEDVDRVLNALLTMKARVLWVTPHRRSLEELFEKDNKNE